MHHRPGGPVIRQFRRRPVHILGRIELAHERNRPARNQRKLNLGPILTGGVVHNGPAFQHRLCFLDHLLAENQTVTRFPDGRRDRVIGHHLALFRIGGIDIHAAFVFRARRRERCQIILELLLQLRIGEADSVGRAQIHVAQLARIQQQRELLALRLLVAARDQAAIHDDSGDGFVSELQLQPRALQLVEHAAQRLRSADLERELGEFMAERVHGIVAQAGDLAAAAFFDGERLQHIVHLRCLEIEARRFARPKFA